MSNENNERVICEICGKEFKDKQGLAGHKRFKHGDQSGAATAVVSTKGAGLDMAISQLKVPIVPQEYDGSARIYWAGFDEGVSYGANTILAGIRAAQELSNLGISQATPVIKMAQEMRLAESQASREAAMQAAAQVGAQVLPRIDQLAAQVAGSGENPMGGLMMTLMQPAFQQAAQQLAKLFGAAQSPVEQSQGQPPAQQPVQPQPQQPAWSPPNIQQRPISEFGQEEE